MESGVHPSPTPFARPVGSSPPAGHLFSSEPHHRPLTVFCCHVPPLWYHRGGDSGPILSPPPRPVGNSTSQRATILPPATTAPASSPPASLPAPIRQARLTDSSSSATPFQSKKAGAPNLETPAKNPGLSHLAQEAPSVTASGDRETVSSLVHAVPLGKRVDYTRLYVGTPCQ
jgi:hypothetical protein